MVSFANMPTRIEASGLLRANRRDACRWSALVWVFARRPKDRAAILSFASAVAAWPFLSRSPESGAPWFWTAPKAALNANPKQRRQRRDWGNRQAEPVLHPD